ncbi:oligosaccharide flippase family protein [Moraxella osloensis]|uniref:Polysaccharide biosynthesis protein n=1 Tax=Faucicola osloensis TaxID=34062 RepID=A0A2D2LUW7_FAUOS|nr:oligosaccharide flippase family protein [Moraxella osloensis]ATR78813.1 hypothetical protein NP7_05790 [Moraxella osloensis]
MLISKIKNLFSDSLYNKIFTNSFWILSGNIVSKLVLLVATILMTNYLSKEEYGQFGIIKSTILMFVMFASMELGITATKYVSQYKNSNRLKVENIVGLSNLFSIIVSFILAITVYFFASNIANQINAPNLTKEIQISSFILFFASLNGVQAGILAGLERFKELSINTTIAGLFSSICLIIASKFYSLSEIVIAFGLNYVLLFILNFLTLRKFFYNSYSVKLFSLNNFNELGVIWRFSFPAILAGLMVSPVTWICNYLLVNQVNGYHEMANFDIANQWRNTILFIPSALSQIVLPLLSSSIEDQKNYKKIFNINLKINFYLGSGLALLFTILSPLIIKLYGENYQNALLPMVIMFITTAIITVNNVIGQAIASQDKMWLGFIVNSIWATSLIFFTYVTINIYNMGALGLSISFLVSYIIHTFIQFMLVRNKL